MVNHGQEIIFSEDWESGTLGDWTDESTDPLYVMQVNNVNPHTGTYALYLHNTANETGLIVARHTIEPQNQDVVTLDAWIYEVPSEDEWQGIGFLDNAGNELYSRISVAGGSGLVYFNAAQVFAGATEAAGAYHEHRLEYDYGSSTVSYWVDGVLQHSAVQAFGSIVKVGLRLQTNMYIGANGQDYFDDIVVEGIGQPLWKRKRRAWCM